jgi:methionyl-tRNA formyltransferase
LPKYRGAAPINWAIIKGEKITGITIIKMNEYIDKGEIILREKIEITDTDTAVSLGEKLSKKGATLLIKCITDIKDNKFSLKPQETTEISYAPELKKSDGLIDWSKNASCLYNQIRGMIPWPGTFTYYQGRLLKIWKAEVCLLTNQASNYRVGQVINVSKDGIIVNCGKDSLEIKELQLEGKKRMRVSEFIIGYKIEVGDRLGYTSRST